MKYKNLLSPVRIGNVVIKNRISCPESALHMLQGPETYPADSYRTWIIQVAKTTGYFIHGTWSNPLQRTVGAPDSVRMQNFNMDDPSVSNYISKMCDDVHFYGSKILLSIMPMSMPWPEGYGFSGGGGLKMPPGIFGVDEDGNDLGENIVFPGMGGPPKKPVPAELIPGVIDKFVDFVKEYKGYGFDGISMPISFLMGKNQNTRTDQYGCDTPENAARLAKEIFGAMKKRLGKDFITEAYTYGMQDNIFTTEFMAQVIKELEDVLDIVSIKEKNAADNHPTGFQFTKGNHTCFTYAKAIRDIGADVYIGVNGGFQDPEELDGYIASGACDFISMARGIFADEDYMEKCLTGRGEDIIPCVWCNKCHGVMNPPWITFCSVNPKLGIDPMLIETMAETTPKKVAVVGGGPIGMRAALMAKERGHDVTLFEKTDYLGGQLFHSDYVSFKWPLRDYKNWLKNQIAKTDITVRLNTEATPELIEAEGFDAVIAATGAEPNIPKFAQDENGKLKEGLMTCLDVFGNEDKLGKRVVIVGGSETGVETGMHLCEKGHEVTVLTRQREIAHDASHLHAITMAIVTYDPDDYHEIIQPAWAKYPTFTGIARANTTEVTPTSVTYTDKAGESHTIEADTVVICGGMKSRQEEALSFFGTTPRFLMTGDCEKVANLQVGNRSAMGKVAQI